MEYKKFNDKYIVCIDKNEEIIDKIKELCEKEQIKLGQISGLGAVNKATIGLFKPDTKEYIKKDLTGAYEITSLTGNISTMDNHLYLHIHASLGDENYNVFGGHLNSAIVSATCELIIEKIDGNVDRKFSDEIGLNLYKF